MKDITTWITEDFEKLLLVNTKRLQMTEFGFSFKQQPNFFGKLGCILF